MATKKENAKVKLPNTIFVIKNSDGVDSWLNAQESPDGHEDGDVVGVYQLVEIKKVKVTTELV